MVTVQLTAREALLLRSLINACGDTAAGRSLRVRAVRRGGSFVTFCIGDCTWISILLDSYDPAVPDSVVPFDTVSAVTMLQAPVSGHAMTFRSSP